MKIAETKDLAVLARLYIMSCLCLVLKTGHISRSQVQILNVSCTINSRVIWEFVRDSQIGLHNSHIWCRRWLTAKTLRTHRLLEQNFLDTSVHSF